MNEELAAFAGRLAAVESVTALLLGVLDARDGQNSAPVMLALMASFPQHLAEADPALLDQMSQSYSQTLKGLIGTATAFRERMQNPGLEDDPATLG